MTAGDADRRAHWERLLDSTALEVAAQVVGETPDTTLIGRHIGPYLVDAWLGAGGMGDVYRAHDTHLARAVALKVLPDAFAVDAAWVARFKREAQVLASLNHPNIAAIYGFEPADGRSAIALELVEGTTLADRIARGAISLDDALPIARQIADALEAAHERGVVHHDLKPSNIALRCDGAVKLLDFGLATAHRPGEPAAASAPAFGTPAYLSPEHAKGQPADKRADIWAFGVVLFEMLTGRRPLRAARIDAPEAPMTPGPERIDWTALPASTPPSVRRLLERCLEGDPRRRLRDIGEARIALESITAGSAADDGGRDGEARARRGRATALAWAALAGAALVAAGTAGVWAWWPVTPVAAPRVTRFPIALAPDRLLAVPTPHHVIALSPDGTHMAYVGSDRIYLREMSALDAHGIAGTEVSDGVLSEPTFSPDGRSIAFWSQLDQTIRTVALAGGTAMTVGRAENPFGLSWAADALYYGDPRQGILRVPATGGTPEVVARVAANEQAHGPQLLPGGALLFTIATGSGQDRWNDARVVVQSASGARTTLLEHATDARYVATGHLVYAAPDGVRAVAFDLARLAIAGPVGTTLAGVRRSSGRRTGAAQFAVSNGGSIVYVPGAALRGGTPYAEAGANAEIIAVDRAGRVERLPLPAGPYREVRISPDGRRLAIAANDGHEAVICVYDRSGARPLQRLTTGGNNRAPVWSADGRRLAFQSDRDGRPGVYWQPADGSAPAERLTTAGPGEIHEPESWMPDGAGFLYSVKTGDGTSIWAMTLTDRRSTRFSDVRSALPTSATLSPDGHWVAYVDAARDLTTSTIVVQPFPATGARYPLVVAQPRDGPANSPHKPLWRRDGAALLYVPRMGGLESVPVSTTPHFAFGKAVAVARPFQPAPPDARRSHDIGPDGRLVGLVSLEPTMSDEFGRATIQVVLDWLSSRPR